jgi:hypothetical protein
VRQGPNSRSHIAQILAMTLACCLVLFLVQIVVHGHEKGQDESACRVCHAAHIGSAPSLNSFLLGAPLVVKGSVAEIQVHFHKDLFANDSPSRAPPAA